MGFESIVRPVVVPNIRPTPSQGVPAADDPNKGVFTIHGTSGSFIELPYSWSASTSQSNPTETKRRVDVARVYQMDDDRNVNKDNYVDIEVANRVWMDDGTEHRYGYNPVQEDDNIEIREHNKIKRRDG